ncbi:SIMPL domain-containing protein [Bacterioplanes sanyensis]|nr:SIMPL domain-containing protein [Bacterioplanes sanyensis]
MLKATTLLLLGSLVAAPVALADNYIEVSGHGVVEAMPDYAKLHLSLKATADTLPAAKQAVDSAMQALLSVANAKGISKDDIDAAQIRNSPQYRWHKQERMFVGEQVVRPVTITLKALNQHAYLVHELMQIDGMHVQHTELRFNDRDALQRQALSKAVKHARSKADAMASAANTRIERVERIIEGANDYHRPMMEMRAMSAMAKDQPEPAPTLFQAQKIEASINVRYEID